MALDHLAEMLDDALAGAVWYLTRRTYTRTGDAKRYALEVSPLGERWAGTFTAPAGATHAYLIAGTTVIELIELEEPPTRIAPGWVVTPTPIEVSDEDLADMQRAEQTLAKMRGLFA